MKCIVRTVCSVQLIKVTGRIFYSVHTAETTGESELCTVYSWNNGESELCTVYSWNSWWVWTLYSVQLKQLVSLNSVQCTAETIGESELHTVYSWNNWWVWTLYSVQLKQLVSLNSLQCTADGWCVELEHAGTACIVCLLYCLLWYALLCFDLSVGQCHGWYGLPVVNAMVGMACQ